MALEVMVPEENVGCLEKVGGVGLEVYVTL